MAGKRFRTDVRDEGSGARPAANAPAPGHQASGRRFREAGDRASAPRASRPVTDRLAAGRPAAHGPRFASASRAVEGTHSFPKLGGSHMHLAKGEVPVTSSVGDVPGASFSVDEAPRPIDPSATGSFDTLKARQGAVISTRETADRAARVARKALPRSERRRLSAAHRPGTSRGRDGRESVPGAVSAIRNASPVLIAGIALAAFVVVALLFVLVGGALAPAPAPAPETEAATAPAEATVDTGQSVFYNGFTYGLGQGDNGWEFTRTPDGGTASALFSFSGTPVSIVLFQGTFYVAENLPDGTWDVICYVVADGSTSAQLLGSDGNPVTGQGSLSSSSLDGSSLVLVDEAGGQTQVPLS